MDIMELLCDSNVITPSSTWEVLESDEHIVKRSRSSMQTIEQINHWSGGLWVFSESLKMQRREAQKKN